ncbi:MAG TPA: Holliday junction branch migration protein RuvA [Fibrobacteraceae bacterium]|jgi:Holliday junction DNA helicase RuvA|nr:Holliday junction branch migration protein RuvA [Fibrobacter sp.]HOG68588.1 Holliday junction branch migration protein RuvA [Fibrobacteraceae bacterium]HPW95005.1 Holliday junction branch migration protein RuvA [Fibrobacteraceae bacterium]
MIEQLRGIMAQKHPTFVILDCGGVGYGIHVSSRTGDTLPEIGTEVTLLTHLVVREDAMILFGFSQIQEKELFLQMIEVNGIGPKMAQRILSSVSVNDFLSMIAREDKVALGKIKGIGKKTSEMLVLALKDKALSISALSGDTTPEILLPNAMQEAIAALHTLGVKDPAAKKAVEKAASILGEAANVSLLIPEALKHV